MKKYVPVLLYVAIGILGLALVVLIVHLTGRVFWVERHFRFSVGFSLVTLGGIVGYVYVMVEANRLGRIFATLFLFGSLYVLSLILIFSSSEPETITVDDHQIYASTERFLFAAEITFYERTNWLMAKEIAVCDDGEDSSCTFDIVGDDLVITECWYGDDQCDIGTIPLQD